MNHYRVQDFAPRETRKQSGATHSAREAQHLFQPAYAASFTEVVSATKVEKASAGRSIK